MQLEVGKKYHVIVINIVKSGAVVELDDKTTALIHISRISDNFVADIRDFVEVRGEYEAIGVEGFAHPVELSLKHLNLRKGAASKKLEETLPERVQKPLRPKPKTATSKTSRLSRNNQPADVLSTFSGAHSCQSLEDMIAASNKDLRDKIGRDPRPRPGKRRRSSGKE